MAQSHMVNVIVSEVYIHFALMYTTCHILLVPPIKNLINEDKNQTIPFKLATGRKNPVSHIHVLFCPYVVRKATAHMGKRRQICITKRKRVFAVSWLE